MAVTESLKSEFQHFSDNWSGHGPHRIQISKHILKKLFYTGVFIMTVVLFGYQIRKLMIKYYSYPVNTIIEIHYDAIRFPAITICNKNAVRKSKLKFGGSVLQGIVNKSEQAFSNGSDYYGTDYGKTDSGSGYGSGSGGGSGDGSGSGSGNGSGSGSGSGDGGGSGDGRDSYYSGDSSWDDQGSNEAVFHKPDDNAWLKAGRQTREATDAQEISMAVFKVNITTRLEMGHQLSEMLQSCSINEETCSTKNFTTFYNARYGDCYTFNGMATTNAIRTFKSGPLFGLKMQLVIEQDEYIGAITRTAGARLAVHDPLEFPFPEDNGIDLAPGKVTSVGLRLACRKTCLQDNIVRTCNCTDTRYSNANFYNARACDNDTDYKKMKLQLCVVALLVTAVICRKDKQASDEAEPHVVTSIATMTFEVKDWDDEGETLTGDVKIGLFGDLVPMTVLNFKSICSGYKREKMAKLHYRNSNCHRLVKDMLVQCGDVVNNDGTGSRSIFGDRFVDENFKVSHASAGIVSMANHGKDTNGSQFFLLFGRARYLDDHHVAFGKVLEGMDVVEDLNKMGTKPKIAVPKHTIKIIDCQVEDLAEKYELPEKVLFADDPTNVK